ncbi:MAG: calcium/sodium antiporter [Candidatus Aminicenantes bacterium]|nr:calcium/sodium antiporter [Candidatus Aminicenantes bacterium]
MAIKLLLFVLGLILLVKGADYFVKAAASLAKKLGVSEFVIGLTLVALGTSVPELASGLAAAFRGQGGLVLGTVIGANIANVLLITGLAAVLAAVRTTREMIGRDGFIMLAATALFCLFAWNGALSRLEAAAMLLVYVAYILFLFTAKAGLEEQYGFRRFLNYLFRFQYVLTIKDGILSGLARRKAGAAAAVAEKKIARAFREGVVKDLMVMTAAGAAIASGADLFVGAAVHFAGLLKVPPVIVGASVVSLGTTLPEMSVTVAAARKGFGHIALGNVLGSCITNIGLIVGASGLVHPLGAARAKLHLLLVFLLFASALLLLLIRSAWRIRRWEGGILLAFYAAYALLLYLALA